MGLVIGQKDTHQKNCRQRARSYVPSRWRHRRPSFYFRIKTTVLNQWILLWRLLKFSKVVMTDTTIDRKYTDLNYSKEISTYLEKFN
jgi:phosphoribosylformylglycinamidine synthase